MLARGKLCTWDKHYRIEDEQHSVNHSQKDNHICGWCPSPRPLNHHVLLGPSRPPVRAAPETRCVFGALLSLGRAGPGLAIWHSPICKYYRQNYRLNVILSNYDRCGAVTHIGIIQTRCQDEIFVHPNRSDNFFLRILESLDRHAPREAGAVGVGKSSLSSRRNLKLEQWSLTTTRARPRRARPLVVRTLLNSKRRNNAYLRPGHVIDFRGNFRQSHASTSASGCLDERIHPPTHPLIHSHTHTLTHSLAH